MVLATDKQCAFIEKLRAERGMAPLTAIDWQGLTVKAASAAIDALLKIRTAEPRRIEYARVDGEYDGVANGRPYAYAQPLAERVTEPGMYRGPDGDPVKVQKSRGSDRLYAKRLVRIGGERLTETDAVVRFEFQYEQGLSYHLRASDRMTLEEAKAFGIRYGVCCVCGAFLKDATSVANGIGPICAGKV
jgi:hypothetical protein